MAVNKKFVIKVNADIDSAVKKMDTLGYRIKSLGRNIVRLGGVFGGISFGLAFTAVIKATREQEAALAQLEQRLKSTGELLASQQKNNRICKLPAKSDYFRDEAIISMQSLLLTFTNIRGDIFTEATEAILDMSVALGKDLKSSAIQVGKALNDPIKGVTALAEAGVSFDESQRELIKTLVELGEIEEAQKIILKELSIEFGGSARAARDTLGGALDALGNAFGDLLEADGGLNEAKAAVEEFTAALGSPAVKQSANSFASGLIQIGSAALQQAIKIGAFVDAVWELAGVASSKQGINYKLDVESLEQKEYIALLNERKALLELITVLENDGATDGSVNQVQAGIDAIEQKLIAAGWGKGDKGAYVIPLELSVVDGSNMDKATEAVTTYRNEMQGATEAQQAHADATRDSISVDEAFAQAVRDADTAVKEANEAHREELEATNEEILGVTESLEQLGGVSGETSAAMADSLVPVSQALNDSAAGATSLNTALGPGSEHAEKLAESMRKIQEHLTESVRVGYILSRDVFGQIDIQASSIAEKLSSIPASLNSAAMQLVSTMDSFMAQLQSAIGMASQLASTLSSAAASMGAINAGGGGVEYTTADGGGDVVYLKDDGSGSVHVDFTEPNQHAEPISASVIKSATTANMSAAVGIESATKAIVSADVGIQSAAVAMTAPTSGITSVSRASVAPEEEEKTPTTSTEDTKAFTKSVEESSSALVKQADDADTAKTSVDAYAASVAGSTESFGSAVSGVSALSGGIEGLSASAAKTTGDMATLGAEGASSLQSAFEEFLFDPFNFSLEEMLTNFVRTLQQMAIQAIASKLFATFGGSGSGGLNPANFHEGGIVGMGGGTHSSVNPLVFANAPRYHSGGIAGLAPDEVPAILQRGELVIPRDQVGAAQPKTELRVYNMVDQNDMANAMASPMGAKVIINAIRINKTMVQQILI